jgi:hypothetical protein
MDTFGGTPDVENRALAKGLSGLDQPLVTRAGFTYTTPNRGPKGLSYALRDWMFNGFLYYASGTPLAPPTANTTGYAANLSQATIANLTFQNASRQVRTGQPLYLQDLNCHCFDPNTAFVLNPQAWANPAPGQFGGAATYGDFRGERRPVENFAVGRQFRIRERMNLNIRAEFTNAFNRTYMNNPSLASPQTAPVCKQPAGGNGTCSQPGMQIVSGFGAINTSTVGYPPRTGQLVAQITF